MKLSEEQKKLIDDGDFNFTSDDVVLTADSVESFRGAFSQIIREKKEGEALVIFGNHPAFKSGSDSCYIFDFGEFRAVYSDSIKR